MAVLLLGVLQKKPGAEPPPSIRLCVGSDRTCRRGRVDGGGKHHFGVSTATSGTLGNSPSSLCRGVICKMGVMVRELSCRVTVRLNAGEPSYHDWFGLKT